MNRHHALKSVVLFFVLLVAGAPCRAQAVRLSLTSMDFQTVAVGQFKSSFNDPTLFNSGTAPLTITSIVASPSVFAVSPFQLTCPTTVPPGTGCLIDLRFAPTGVGTFNGTLTITDNAPGSPHIVNLTGTGVDATGPVPNWEGTNMKFGNWAVGRMSGSVGLVLNNRGVNIANPSAATLTITSIVATPSVFSILSNTCPSSLAPGTGCDINVAFTPTAAGVVTGSLTITDNATANPQVVPLTGTGVSTTGPVLSDLERINGILLEAASEQPVVIGTTHAPSIQAAIIRNSGSAPLIISSMVATPGFAILTNCPFSPNSVAVETDSNPGGCLIYPSFTPTVSGGTAGSLTITDNAADSPQTLTLTGIAQPPSGPIPSLSPMTLNFGTAVGVVSAPQNITLTNTGTAALPITGISSFSIVQGTGTFAQTNNCPIGTTTNPVTLPAGASCTISVTFTSTAPGTFLGGVSILDDAGSPAFGINPATEQDVTAVVTVGPPPSFSVAASNSSATVTAGQSRISL